MVGPGGSLQDRGKLFQMKATAKAAVTKAIAGHEYASRNRFMKEHGYKYDDMYKPSVQEEYNKVRAIEIAEAKNDYRIVEFLLQPVQEYTVDEFREM